MNCLGSLDNPNGRSNGLTISDYEGGYGIIGKEDDVIVAAIVVLIFRFQFDERQVPGTHASERAAKVGRAPSSHEIRGSDHVVRIRSQALAQTTSFAFLLVRILYTRHSVSLLPF